jgi:uncharacterized protein with PIN domain
MMTLPKKNNRKTVTFRFYEELNDFLPKKWRKTAFSYQFSGSPDLEEVIHMIGIPHTEIDLILVNGQSVAFDYRLAEGDYVSVYPVFESIDISPINHLRPKPLRKIKFILDIHLGRLTKYLRMCGFDCYYENLSDEEIIKYACDQKRIILTKDKGLLKNKRVTHGYWVRAILPKQQLVEVINRFDLVSKIQFLTRCLLCNARVERICKEQIAHLLPEDTVRYYTIFYSCRPCNKIYWEGSHYKNMANLIDEVKKRVKR